MLRAIDILFWPAFALTAATGLLAGCTQLSTQPRAKVQVQWSAQQTSVAAMKSKAVQRHWWQSFNDSVLDQLIGDALRSNNDLAAAAIRVYRAQLQAGLVNTNLAPTVTLDVEGNVARTLEARQISRSGNMVGTLSYELDLWGKLAAERDAAAWELKATEEDRWAARLSLIGATAELYWRLGYLNQQIALGDANIAYAEQTLALVRTRYAVGAASGLDVAQAEQNLSNQRAMQTQWLQQRAESRHALATVFARPSQYRIAEPDDLSGASLPDVPAGLPADLLRQRPDLRAAEFRLRKSLENINVTRTSFYPSFALTGSLGGSSGSLLHVMQNPVAMLGWGLALPFIQWNTMKLDIKVSQSQYEEAAVNFRQTLLQALSEVDNALSARSQLHAEAQQLDLSVAQAQRAERLAKARFRAGATGVQPWLDMQRNLRDAQGAQALNRLNRLNNRMHLYQVLGGGDAEARPL